LFTTLFLKFSIILFSNTLLESESISVFRCIEGKVCTHLSALERANLLLNQRSEFPYTKQQNRSIFWMEKLSCYINIKMD